MSRIHFANLDLNLLRVFEAVAEEGSVTRAGERLGLSQSAVSHALNRLRSALDDDLFIRTSEGMRLTPWAIDAAPKVSRALGQLQRALAPAEFDPAHSDRRFRLGLTPYLSTVLAPSLTRRFRQEAPGAELVLRHPTGSVSEALDMGRLDVALGAFDRLSERFEKTLLFSERLVWVMRRANPAASQPLTLERLAEIPHLIVATTEAPEDGGPGTLDRGVERARIWGDGGAYARAMAAATQAGGVRAMPAAMTAPDSQTLLSIVSQTDMAALAPLRLARLYQPTYDLVIRDPPYATELLEIVALWRSDHGAHPAVAWFIHLISETATDLVGTESLHIS